MLDPVVGCVIISTWTGERCWRDNHRPCASFCKCK